MGINMFRLVGIFGCMLLIWAAIILASLGAHSAVAQAQPPDTTPPRLGLPGSITVEAISRQGVAVTYLAKAFDASGPVPTVICNPASGSIFPLGSTTVSCTATDAAGNSGSGSFPVTVRDITPPSLTLPANFKTEASSRLGALVLFANSVSDLVDPSPVVVCDPHSGSVFPLGVTTVSCTGIDASGNVAGEHFVVTVEDTSLPTILGLVSPSPNINGWNNTDVAVTFTCSDTASGVVTCDGDATLSREGYRQSVGGISVDAAGNIATATVIGINIDKTVPVVLIKSPARGAEYLLSEPILTDWEVRDTLSGVDNATGTSQSGLAVDTSSLGAHEFSLTAIDRAGNSVTVSHSYTVVSPFADFVMHNTEVELEGGSPRDEFLVEGVFTTGGFSDGIHLPNEAVTVTFDGFTQTIPSASFIRESNGLGFQYDGTSGGVTRFIIRDDGQFLVKAEMLRLRGVGLSAPVHFSLRIGDDLGQAVIFLDDEGPFRLEVRQTRDFFGTVLSTAGGILIANTDVGAVEVPVTASTSIRLSQKSDAKLADLIIGDLVAVSLEKKEGEYFANKVVRVPVKTRNKHVPGEVVAITDTHITVSSTVPEAEPVTFRRTRTTPVRFHRGESKIGVGAFVIVGAVSDPLTGLLSAEAREINVIPRLEAIKRAVGGDPVYSPPYSNQVKIVGVLEGIDKDGDWIVNGAVIAIGAFTQVDEGLTVGQTIQVRAELRPGGFLLAHRAAKAVTDQGDAAEIKLEGIFEGIDESVGDWVISGLPISVATAADTDGLPFLGQTIKVLARLKDDGSLLVREIENKFDSENSQPGSTRLKVQGTFLRVDTQENWEVNGVKFAVDRSTRMQGSPVLGHPITVEAVRQEDGSFLAQHIEGETLVEFLPGNRAKLRGRIEETLDDGSLVIQGISVSRGVLTKVAVELQDGDFVEAEILIQNDGSLLAIGIEPKDEDALREFPDSSPVSIQGILERVNSDGTLIVNGIVVATGPLTSVRGKLIAGPRVNLEGMFKTDGSIAARELKILGQWSTLSGVETRVQGRVEEIDRDRMGNAGAISVNGVTISLDTLTRIKGNLEVGTRVSAEAIIADGTLVAREVEELDSSADPQADGRFVIKGAADAIGLNDQGLPEKLDFNGLEIEVSSRAIVSEFPVSDSSVQIQGDINGGVMIATSLEPDPDAADRQGLIEFDIQGSVASIIKDDEGLVAEFVVDGNRLSVQTLTLFDGILRRGMIVRVDGIVSEGQLLASRIKHVGANPVGSDPNRP